MRVICVSYFIYPDESSIKGSTVAFHALLLAMIERGVMAITRVIARKGAIPRFVALLPQMEVRDENGWQGKHMCYLMHVFRCFIVLSACVCQQRSLLDST